MPDVDQEVVVRLKNRRPQIAKLPPEQQAKLYSFAFNHFVATSPGLKAQNLKPEELEQAKVKWVENVIGRKMGGPLDFEAPKEELPFFSFTRGVAKLKAIGAAGVGSTATSLDAIHNMLDVVKGSPTAPTGLETKVKGFLRAVEAKNWDEAQQYLTEDELYKFGGLGKMLVSYLGAKYAIGGAKVLGAATDWPVVSSLGAKTLNKVAIGAAGGGGGTAAFTSDPKRIEEWIVGGAVLDALVLPGLGKAAEKTLGGVSKAYERVRGLLSKGRPPAPAPVAAPVGGTAEPVMTGGVFEQVMKERYPDEHAAFKKGARLDQALDNEKFLNVQREAEVRAGAAEKAKREAGKPKVLTLEEKAHAQAVKKADRVRETAAAKALQSALTSYRKRAGNVPSIGSPHYERLKAGESVDSILGIASVETEKTAIDAAVGVAEKSDAEAVAVAVPSAVKAVETVRDIVSKVGPRQATVEGAAISDPSWLMHEKQGEVTRLREILRNPQATVEEKNIARSQLETHLGSKPESMFNVPLNRLADAKTPEEYAAAKRLAEQGIDEQANARVRDLQAKLKAGTISVEEATQQGLKMAEEVKAAKQRIKTTPIPKTISKKALDAKRKSSEIATATRTAIKESAELIASDPESKMVENIDRVDKAKKALEQHPKLVESVYKEFMKLRTGDAGVLAEMLETELAKLEKK